MNKLYVKIRTSVGEHILFSNSIKAPPLQRSEQESTAPEAGLQYVSQPV